VDALISYLFGFGAGHGSLFLYPDGLKLPGWNWAGLEGSLDPGLSAISHLHYSLPSSG
jgi:hypothetical protein